MSGNKMERNRIIYNLFKIKKYDSSFNFIIFSKESITILNELVFLQFLNKIFVYYFVIYVKFFHISTNK
jgi:hypothetical protein